MAGKPKLVVNGLDITDRVDIDSYATSLEPVYGDTVTTMDGVEHIAVIRYKGVVKFALNPQTDTATAELCSALLTGAIEVHYHCLQRNTEIIANMRIDGISAQYLGRVRFTGRKWNEIPAITLTEL